MEVSCFRPKEKEFKRILQQAKNASFQPALKDIEAMAQDSIKDAPQYIEDPRKLKKAIRQARKTIADVERIERS